MTPPLNPTEEFYTFLMEYPERLQELYTNMIISGLEKNKAMQLYWEGLLKYFHDFVEAYWIAVGYFQTAERKKLLTIPAWESIRDYTAILQMNLQLATQAISSSYAVTSDYHLKELTRSFSAFMNTILDIDGEDLESLSTDEAELMERVVQTFPKVIRDIRSEYGFHFESGNYIKTAETDRFILYQILPTDKKVRTKKNGKPLIVIPPYVLGCNVLAFLPGDNKSYVHNYANHGIPIYIRVNKNIATTPEFQLMTGEDDARDTRLFCEVVKKKHGKPVTLNGYCQGGFNALCNILSGELDGLVDALITCVSPMDGTRSKGLGNFLKVMLPQRFNDLSYGTKRMPNGNLVADGKLMGWVYKLKAIQDEFPLVSMYRDMIMLTSRDGKDVKINKTVAAIQHWLRYERVDLPLGITDISFKSYNIPIRKDGTLPIELFGRKLNLHGMKEKGIKWLICYGESDDLVEKETALAPLDFIDVEVTPFPKGHLAMATSWSNPDSEYALHTRFGEGKRYRGPVRYQLDLDDELSKKGGKGG